jgi:hypothetical protein
MSSERRIRGTLFSGGRFEFALADDVPPDLTGHGPAVDRDRLARGVLSVDGRSRSIDSLLARDFHALRALATARGLLPDPAVSIPCSNCEKRFLTRPGAAFPTGPFDDAELNDDELDAPFLYDVPHPVAGQPGEVYVRIAERTVAELLPAWRAVAEGRTAFSRAFVEAWGLRAVGDANEPGPIALALRSDEILALSVEELLGAAHYPARLTAEVRCPSCDAANLVEVPFYREFLDDEVTAMPLAAEVSGRADFPDDATFARIAEGLAAPFLAADADHAERAIVPRAPVAFRVDAGIPAVDASGVPLLGSYRPSVDGLPPIVTLYTRSFRELAGTPATEESADWHEELEETVRHEFAHHAAALAGFDEVDDDEQAEIEEADARRRGRRVVARERSPLRHPLFWAIVLALLGMVVLALRGR